MPLTPRQQRFIDEYLIDLDARHAAARAGYRASTRHIYGLIRQPKIATAIGAAMAARARRTGITRERVLAEYARIAFADLRQLADWGPHGAAIADAAALSDEAAAAIALIDEATDGDGATLHLKTFDKLKALEALARLLDPRRRSDDGKAPPPRDAEREPAP